MRSTCTWSGLLLRLLVAAFLFTAANIVTYRTSHYFQQEHDYHLQVAQISSRPAIRVLFCGDSHVAHRLNERLNDEAAGPAYSVAWVGDSPREAYAKVRRALEQAPLVDTLIVSAEPHMFAKVRLHSSNRSFADLYFIVALDGTGLEEGWPAALLNQIPLFNDDFVQYFKKALATQVTTLLRPTSLSRARSAPWSELSEAERAMQARRAGRLDSEGLGEYAQQFAWYERTLDLARKRHVRVIGVRYPVHPEYAAQASAEKVAAIDEFLRRQGVTEILDLRGMPAEPGDFEDPDHVSRAGAKLLLRALQARIRRPLMAGTGTTSDARDARIQ